MDTFVVEAETNVGGVSQSQRSGSHGRSSIVNSSIRDGHMAVVEVGVGWNMAVVGDSRGNTMGVGGRQDTMAVGCGEDSMAVGGGEDSMAVGCGENSMAVGCGEDSMAVGCGEDSRVDNSGISFSFSLLHNMLEFTILGYITGDTERLTKRSGVSSVVVRSLIVADNLSRSSHGMSGIAGDRESRVRDNWSNLVADHWGSVGGDWSHIGDSRNRSHRMSGIAGDWESRVGVGGDNWSNLVVHHWGSVGGDWSRVEQ